ncbi:MAG: hypothetical protein A2Y02_01430 [Omnitrophica bacterium GWA2_52_12]|nr:MAG: hypothetical protein A2Y02_01430 [Omnitrophica bacterium GWA2_52_12]
MKLERLLRFLAFSTFIYAGLAPWNSAWAVITVDPDFTGTLILTAPDGNVTLFESGDPLPVIQDGATLEVFDGNLTIHIEGDEHVQVGCFGQNQTAGGGSTASLSCGESSGTLKIGDKEYALSAQPEEKPAPTAAAEPTGVPLDGTVNPDSRSIQASPQS